DSDFSPLVHKLRELNKQVIGVGLKASTSKLLPPACDEFIFYENLHGVDEPQARVLRRGDSGGEPETQDLKSLDLFISRTIAGLLRSGDTDVRSSQIKRAALRKDSTFSESDYGFRSFGELMRNLAERGVVRLDASGRQGDPEVSFPSERRGEMEAFVLLEKIVLAAPKGEPVPLSRLKDDMRKKDESFSERSLGYSGFLQFVRAANARGIVDLSFDEKSGSYNVGPA
ncbi:MAG: NYN domain-containing protein, partial [Actinomycetia bacterium]|nr:NYN domain-containing protein [Actinomycetes bacterium]